MITGFIATGNAHKVGELRSLLGVGYTLLSTREVPSGIDPAETGATFEDNARIKAVAWARHLATLGSLPPIDWVLADDSGLEVDALGGAPGVHSARYAALDDGRPGNSGDAENNAKLLRRMADIPEGRRQARFRCVLALTPVLPAATEADLHLQTRCFEGVCNGRLLGSASGSKGFGYDPLFVPDGHAASFAELGDAVKGSISHRSQAAARLREFLNRNGGSSRTSTGGGGR